MCKINDLSEIPAFKDEAEEAEWWGAHTLSDELVAGFTRLDLSSELPPPRERPDSRRFRVGDPALTELIGEEDSWA